MQLVSTVWMLLCFDPPMQSTIYKHNIITTILFFEHYLQQRMQFGHKTFMIKQLEVLRQSYFIKHALLMS